MREEKRTRAIDLKRYTPGEGLIHRYQKLVKEVVIPYQYQVMSDRIPDAEKSHVIQNFINAGKALAGEDVGDGFYGMVFQDSDAAKWLEAVAYSLVLFPDPELEAVADDLIDKIAAAQDADGYLDTYFTIKDRDRRWTNLLEAHELYCAGHMMEAAAAYHMATGKTRFLTVMERNAEHLYRHFITEGAEGYPGHPEVELGLLRMYQETGNDHCLQLAKHFIDVRGVDRDYYKKEKARRDWTVWGNNAEDCYYQQNYAPVREMRDAVGHSVRAVYLYSAMAELAAAEGADSGLRQACEALWQSITGRRMYVTGGIGSTCNGEAFTVDYDLPNDTAYAETCASVGLIFFASKMLELAPKGCYGDVMERALYNTVLAGMQLDGTRFFYVNPLQVVPGISHAAATHYHVCTTRPKWYACACCPPNVARLLGSLGRYAYGENASTAFCHLFAAGTVTFANGMKLTCETAYPYDFTIRYRVEGTGPLPTLALRLPAWSRQWQMMKNEALLSNQDYVIKDGYIYVDKLQSGDEIELTLDGRPYYAYASTKVAEDTDKVCVGRGPLIYCFEGVDNGADVLGLMVDDTAEIGVEAYNPDLLSGIVPLTVKGWRLVDADAEQAETGQADHGSAGPDGCTGESPLYLTRPPKKVPVTLHAIPYYAWANRGETQMRVWMNR